MGFLVMEETFDTWTAAKPNANFGYQLYFNEWWHADTTAMITRDRNHPSIVIWSIGNEIRDNLTTDEGKKRMGDQIDLVHKLDPTRPVTMGLFRPNVNGPYIQMLDVIGANYAPQFLTQVKRADPTKKVTISEDSHGRGNWIIVRDNPAIAGTFIWSGIDYLGETAEAGSWPYVVSSSASNGFGIIEHSGYMRPRAYERMSWWSKKPMVHVSRFAGHAGEGQLVNDWSPADEGTFDKARVQVFTTCDEAELFLNGTSLGTKPRDPNGAPLVWDLDFQPGSLKVVGKIGGQIAATHEMKTAGDVTKLGIEADRKTVQNKFDDVSHITVSMQDEKGVINPNDESVLSFKVEGPGKLVGLSTGDRTSHQSFTASERKAYHGEVIAIVRATGDAGEIKLTVTSGNLPPATITLQAAPAK
jgi:beta-galactosidase